MRAPRLSVWPPLRPAAARRGAPSRPFPLDRSGNRLFARARHGLYVGVRALGLGDGDRVLVPAFHHGSEVEALARAGLEPVFYELGPDLRPDPDELESLLDPRVRALHLIHVLGLPLAVARWRAWCDERQLLLFEDAAMGWLATDGGEPVGSRADLAIFCLYKTVGVPDGGAVVGHVPIPEPRPGSLGAVGAARRVGAWAASRWGWVAASRRAGDDAYEAARDFDLGEPVGARRITASLASRLAPGAAARRRANYLTLARDLGARVPAAFPDLPAGASPFAFPVEVPDAVDAVRVLARAGVDALALWAAPHPALPADRFPAAAALRGRVVALPVHQELRGVDLERIAAAGSALAAP